MSYSEEDSYSMIFASLKHPIRRKILRILSNEPQTFSDLQKQFNIESSHLTYHIDGLGNLLHKTEDGKYALSSLGEAAVSMMKNVEEPSPILHFPFTRQSRLSERVNGRAVVIAFGMILLVFGATLVATSYLKIYDTYETIAPTAHVLPIQANSSSDFILNFNPFFGTLLPQTQRVLVVVTGSQELQGILNSTLNCNSTMELGQNITISLVSENQTISATAKSGYTITYDEPIAGYTFDIPADWLPWFYIRIANPESYPVCWIVNVLAYGQVVNNTWLTLFFVGIIPIILGLIFVGVAGYRRKAINKEKA